MVRIRDSCVVSKGMSCMLENRSFTEILSLRSKSAVIISNTLLSFLLLPSQERRRKNSKDIFKQWQRVLFILLTWITRVFLVA